MKKLINQILIFFYQHQTLFIIGWLFIFSFFLKSYRIDYFISYHQDQVRDLYYVKEYFDQGKLILLGPKASVGDFFLPPFWYYLMAISYLFSPSPIAPAILTALLSSITTIIIFIFVKKYFSNISAFLVSTLYAVSPLSIEYSRFAWNPNPIPLFVILTFFSLFKYLDEKKEKYFYLGIVASNLALQLHYQGMIIFAFYFLVLLFNKKINVKNLFRYIIVNIVLFLPFIIYEATHQFTNTHGIISFLFNTQAHSSLKYFGIPFFIKFIIKDFSLFLGRVMFFKNQILGLISLVIIAVSLLLSLVKLPKLTKPIKLINLFLIFSFIMLFVYKNSLIDFYLLFLIPIIIIYFSIILFSIIKEKMFLIITGVLILINLILSPAFGNYDRAYASIDYSVRLMTQKPDYCIAYKIFPQNFIEYKYKYLISQIKHQPVKADCYTTLSFRCDPRITTIYYVCEEALCRQPYIDLTRAQNIDINPYNPGVKIYKFNF